MNKCVFAGSFDPITNGHLEIIEKASKVYSQVIVGVLVNWDKEYLFSKEDRFSMVEEACRIFKNVQVKSYDGTLVDFLRQEETNVYVRGIRDEKDLEYENACKKYHQKFLPQIEYVYFCSEKSKDISSTKIKEMAKAGLNISTFVPKCVIKYFK